MAHAQGADFVEQDLVLTRDHVPVVLHDIQIDTVTDVAARFPDRRRADGRWYALDLTLAEIQTLNVHERTDPRTGRAVFPDRFPVGVGSFRVPTLEEEIDLVSGLNRSTGRRVGIYPEIKSPAWHRAQGVEISPIVVEILNRRGMDDPAAPCFVQCFEFAELRRLRDAGLSRAPDLPDDGHPEPGAPDLTTPPGGTRSPAWSTGSGRRSRRCSSSAATGGSSRRTFTRRARSRAARPPLDGPGRRAAAGCRLGRGAPARPVRRGPGRRPVHRSARPRRRDPARSGPSIPALSGPPLVPPYCARSTQNTSRAPVWYTMFRGMRQPVLIPRNRPISRKKPG